MKAAGMMPQGPAQQAPQEQQPKAPEGGGVPAGNTTGTGNANIGAATPVEPGMPEFSGQSPVFPEGVQ